MDHYERLGVSRDASKQEIIVAHRKLAKQTHPDSGGSTDEFKKIQEAYRILSDEQERAHYDKTGRERVRSSEVEQHVAQLLASAFEESSYGDPIDLVRRQIREGKRAHVQSAKKISQLARKLKARIARFEQRNRSTKNVEARDFVMQTLLRRYDTIETDQKLVEARIELGDLMLEFLEGLSGLDEETQGRHRNASTIFQGPITGFSGSWSGRG